MLFGKVLYGLLEIENGPDIEVAVKKMKGSNIIPLLAVTVTYCRLP